jgi:hypothetical protein
MPDPPLYSGAGDDPDVGVDRDTTTGTPRWVKVFGTIAIIVAVLFVILMLVGGGRHGPGRHRLSDGRLGGQTPPAGVTENGGAQPEAVHS